MVRHNHWRDGRVVDYNGLENRRTERYRGFESLSLRQQHLMIKQLQKKYTQFYIQNVKLGVFVIIPSGLNETSGNPFESH